MMAIGDEAAPACAYPEDLQFSTQGRSHAGRYTCYPTCRRALLGGLRTTIAFVRLLPVAAAELSDRC